METLIFGLGAAFLVIMGVGLGMIYKALRELTSALEKQKDATITQNTALLHIAKVIKDKKEGETSHDSLEKPCQCSDDWNKKKCYKEPGSCRWLDRGVCFSKQGPEGCLDWLKEPEKPS